MAFWVMQALCPETDMSDESFPFRCVKEVAMGYARVNVSRITYLGELGYELQVYATMRVELIGHFKPCITDIYLHI